MQVLIVHPRMSIMGGGERVAIHSILAARNLGYDVSLLTEHFDTRRFEEFFGCYSLFNKAKLVTFPRFNTLVRGSLLLYQRLLYYQMQLRKALSGPQQFQLVLGTQDVGYTPMTRVPVVQYCYFPEYFRHLQSSPASPLWKLYYRPAQTFYRNRVHYIDRFLSVSNYTREFVKGIWGRDSTTVYPPCPVKLYTFSNAVRENLVITIGRIVEEKRMHIMLEIARKLPDVKFAIIGSVASQEDNYYKALRENAPDNLSFVLSPLRKVREILGRAKVYVHCAQGEHFGITIVEAMAAGCVPVVHDSGGPREIVTQGAGYRWQDVGEATEQISRLMYDERKRSEMSAASTARAAIFGEEAFESSMEQVLKEYDGI
ncbi:glycosyltransferase [Candidatus Bathyarchaeota archaeon]|nr:MAG: glycosyltransferase [Candidatus Bathyarchaeota archaeon]